MNKEKLGTPNYKAMYTRFGFMAEEMQTEMEDSEDKNQKLQFAQEARSMLNGMIKVCAQENSDKRTDALIDEHNRKYGTEFKRRNLELKKFDETES